MEAVAGRHHDPGHPPARGPHGVAGGALIAGDIELHVHRLNDPQARDLLAELDDDLTRRYGPGDPVRAVAAEFEPPGGLFLIALDQGVPRACGGYRRIDAVAAELKRMYVRPQARGTGLARLLLAALETAAHDAGYEQLWLETGISQPEAMALYESAGYRPIPSFGQYAGADGQRCYGKALEPPTPSNRAPLW